MSFGQGDSLASFGITPSRFWFSKMRSRSLFQPSSNSFILLILSTHSLVGWCGACVAPGAYLMKIGLLGSVWCIRVIQSIASSAIAGDEVPARLALERIDLRRVAEQVRLPLVGVAADEAVEVLEAHAGRPLVERPDLAGREGRRVVVLAEPGRGVAVVEQDPSDRGLVLVDDAVVAGEAGRLLGDHAESGRMVVAPGDQRGARRRAQRGGEDPVVAQALPSRCGPWSASE